MRYWVLTLCLWGLWSGVGEACQLYRASATDRSGNAVNGASVSIKVTGTSTSATIYSDADCTTATTNPLTTGASGIFSFWIADGLYDIAISATGYSFDSALSLKIFDPIGENVKTVGFYTTGDLCATTLGAIDQIDDADATLYISQNSVTCTLDKTAPANIAWWFVKPGLVTVSSGKTLTILGPVVAPAIQIFAGTGTVSISTSTTPMQYDIWTGGTDVGVKMPPSTFANLGSADNGTFVYCSDCTFANPCAGSGTGAMAKRLNGAWRCD